MFSVTDDLVAVPEDPAEVCHLIASFLESWDVTPAGPVIQAAEDEVSGAERRLGLALPAALRWAFTRLGTDSSVIGRQDPFVRPADLTVDGEGVVTYRTENQNCATWGFRVGESAHPDPPVLWHDLESGAGWQPYQGRLSVDLLEMAFSEAMLLSGANVLQRELASGPPPELASLSPIAIPPHVFWAIPDGPPVTWHGAPDCLVRNDGDVWLWAFGRTAEAVDRVTSAIPGGWSKLEE